MLRTLVLAGIVSLLAAAFQFTPAAEASPNSFSILGESCGAGGGVQMSFGWSGSDPYAQQQRLDIGLSTVWQPGSYASSFMSPGLTSMSFTGLASNSVYYARDLQLMPGIGWDSSPTYVFTTRTACLVMIAAAPSVNVISSASETQGVRTNVPNPAAQWLGSAATSSRRVKRGTNVDIGASAKGSLDAVGLIDIEVFGPNGAKVFQQYYDNVSLSADVYRSYINHWTVPADALPGNYTVKVGVFTPGFGTLVYWNNEAATVAVY